MNLRKEAKGRPCTIRLPGCSGGGEDSMLCHYSSHRFGNGMGCKSDDFAAAFGCASCHDIADGRVKAPGWMAKAEVRLAHAEAVIETGLILRKEGKA